MKLSSI